MGEGGLSRDSLLLLLLLLYDRSPMKRRRRRPLRNGSRKGSFSSYTLSPSSSLQSFEGRSVEGKREGRRGEEKATEMGSAAQEKKKRGSRPTHHRPSLLPHPAWVDTEMVLSILFAPPLPLGRLQLQRMSFSIWENSRAVVDRNGKNKPFESFFVDILSHLAVLFPPSLTRRLFCLPFSALPFLLPLSSSLPRFPN